MSAPSHGSITPLPPVTVSITRLVHPDHVPEVTRWVQEGVNLANRWPGFLGSGWVRTSATSNEWHMLYRFADATLLDSWECSDQRAEWLKGGSGLVEERRVRRLTGIEGWFDLPSAVPAAAGPASAPLRWKQAVSIWLGFFPVNLAFTLLVGALVPAWADWNALTRVFLTTVVLTPLMAYFVLPFVTRLLHPWLQRRGPGR